jgi:Ca-activated chloride channel homolog
VNYSFAQPLALLLLLLLPAWVLYERRSGRRSIVFSATQRLADLGPRRAELLLARLPDWFRIGALAALIIALAGPRTGAAAVDVDAEGIAIMLAIDISSSMLAEDFAPHNRMVVARRTVADFIRGRETDRIGLVPFAGEALTHVPLTVDYAVLFRALEQVDVGMLEDGTAIGTAIATAANRLRHASGESRVIILLTDGENNRGEIDPRTAARAAAAFGIRIYTIGVGTEGVARMPVARNLLGGYQYAMLPVRIDEELLRDVAATTGGIYYRATDGAALDSIYRSIDALERSSVEVRRYVEYTPRYLPFLLLGSLVLALEWSLRASRWGRIP